jgi:integrase
VEGEIGPVAGGAHGTPSSSGEPLGPGRKDRLGEAAWRDGTAEDLKQKRDIVQSLSEDSEDLVDQVVAYSDEAEDLIALARAHGMVIPRDLNMGVKDLIFGKARVWDARLRAEDVPKLPEEKTLSGLCRRYQEQHDLRRLAGDLSPGESYLISHHTRGFVDWIGADHPPQAVTASRWEDYWKHLLGKVGDGKMSPAYAVKYLKYARRFIVWMASMGLVTVPPNLQNKGYRFSTVRKALVTFTVEEVRSLLEAAPGQLKLHLHLMINCGFTQSDIASLRPDEVDLDNGSITRKRSKTRQRHGRAVPLVTWTLWPITSELFRRYHSAHPELALTTERGKPWVEEGIKADGKPYSRDAIQSNFRHVQKRLGQAKTLKSFRKTSSTMLDGNGEYGRYAQHFLGHVPDSVAGRHYVTPSQVQFDAAVRWLGDQYGLISPV